jgi:hypothetical protein
MTQTPVSTRIVTAMITAVPFGRGSDLEQAKVSRRQAAAEFIVERLDQPLYYNMGRQIEQLIPEGGAILAT